MLSAVDPPGKRKRYLNPRSRRAVFSGFRSDSNSVLEAMDFLQAEPDLSDLVHRDSKTGELYVEGASHYLWDCVYDCRVISGEFRSVPLFVWDKPSDWTRPSSYPAYVQSDTKYNVDGEPVEKPAPRESLEKLFERIAAALPRVIRFQNYQCDVCSMLMEHAESHPGQWDKGPVYVSPGLFHKPHYPVAGEPQCEGLFHRVGLNTERKE